MTVSARALLALTHSQTGSSGIDAAPSSSSEPEADPKSKRARQQAEDGAVEASAGQAPGIPLNKQNLEQLKICCEFLDLDAHGTVKQLRRRIAEHVSGEWTCDHERAPEKAALFRGSTGPSGPAKDVVDPVQLAELLLTDAIQLTLAETIRYAPIKRQKMNELAVTKALKQNKAPPDPKPVWSSHGPPTLVELRCWLAIFFYKCLNTQLDIRDSWQTDILLHQPAVAEAMSRDRFLEIGTYLHVADSEHPQAKTDKFWKVRRYAELLLIVGSAVQSNTYCAGILSC
jgi:hypothetical protein